MGHDLGCGAYLSALRRTAIGDFSVDDAFRISDLVELNNEQRLT
jgi:tRNA pseudouridine55 synthase